MNKNKVAHRTGLNREERARTEQYKITYACMNFAIAMENYDAAKKLRDTLETMENFDPSLRIWEHQEG